MAKVYFISDHHFGHYNIIEYTNRPFKIVGGMDTYMINEWNKVVNKEDKVFILGDFSFHDLETTKTIVSVLKGNKTLILGNHDRRRSLSWWRGTGLDEVYEFPIIYKKRFVLSHEPLYHFNGHDFFFNIHGHIHNCEPKVKCNNLFNVSCEVLDYKPINIDKIKLKYSLT